MQNPVFKKGRREGKQNEEIKDERNKGKMDAGRKGGRKAIILIAKKEGEDGEWKERKN